MKHLPRTRTPRRSAVKAIGNVLARWFSGPPKSVSTTGGQKDPFGETYWLDKRYARPTGVSLGCLPKEEK
ncbi:MAG: hypothetical protein V4681_03490 [Patescibacteria group bacterium]